MTNLTVWAFDAAGDAESALLVLEGLADQGAIVLHDAAAVSWQAGQQRDRVRPDCAVTRATRSTTPSCALEAQLPQARSALLVRSSQGQFDEIRRSFRWTRNRLLSSDVDADAAAELREVLGPDWSLRARPSAAAGRPESPAYAFGAATDRRRTCS
jgi:uncharacterized membrane protein